MPLSFEKWGSDRRKKEDKERKDGKKEKKKKKLKSSEEELLEREIEELKCQLHEERQNTRREKLNSARLQKELAESKTESAMKETLAQALVKQEQDQRLRTEQRLTNVLTENEAFKAQLAHLRSNMTVTEKADEETQEKLQNGPVMNEAGPNNNGEVEPRVVDEKSVVEELQKEKALLLERLRVLESSNSALVLEGEKHQEVYERCLDEVASQVVQALLIQRELKEECTKLRNRVEELEIHNRQLRHLFEQEIWMQKQTHENCGLENGTHHQSPSANDCANSGTASGHHHNGPSAVVKHTFFSQTEMHQWPPHHHHHHHLLTSHLNGNNRARSFYPGTAFHRQVSLPNTCFSGSLPSGGHHTSNLHFQNGPTGPSFLNKSLPSSVGMEGYEEFAGGGECLGSSDVVSDLTSFGPSNSDFSGNYFSTDCDATKSVARKTQSLPTTPLSQRSAAAHRSHLRNQTTFEFTENHNYLSDKYTKPYVHAPLDYAQSLLQELQEIGASVKSFESLTLEPRSNPSQKRKVFGDLEPTPQPQKLVKANGFDLLRSNGLSNLADNADSFSLEDFPPDGTGSITSGESIETAYERIIPSPEKSPQKHDMLVPMKQVKDKSADAHTRGDVLFDLDENLLDSQNQNEEPALASAFSPYSSPFKVKSNINTESGESEHQQSDAEKGKKEEESKDTNKVADGLKKLSVQVEDDDDDDDCNHNPDIIKPYSKAAALTNSTDVVSHAEESTSISNEIPIQNNRSPPQTYDLQDVKGLENIAMSRSGQLWQIEADTREEEKPPLPPPRKSLVSRSFESISDEVFMADNSPSEMKKVHAEVDGELTEINTPPELPPKPLWMRIGDISLSPDSACEDLIEPPPIPERRPIEPEGQECLSWQWRESYDPSEMETGRPGEQSETRSLWSEAVEKITETDMELRTLISSESEPEEEGVDYLAMWKAREKSPASWKTCMDTDVMTGPKPLSAGTETHSTGCRTDEPTDSEMEENTAQKPTEVDESTTNKKPPVSPRLSSLESKDDNDKLKSASIPMIQVNVRKESLGKCGSDSKLEKGAQKKTKSSIPLFKSRKDASKKGQNSIKDKSVVKDIVSTIKAVMDSSSSSKGTDKTKTGNPLRRSFRNKSQKTEKSNGHCQKMIPEIKTQESASPAKNSKSKSKLPRVTPKQSTVPNHVNLSAKEKPPVASPNQKSALHKLQMSKSLHGKPSGQTCDTSVSVIPKKGLGMAKVTTKIDDVKGDKKETKNTTTAKENDLNKETKKTIPVNKEEKTNTSPDCQWDFSLGKHGPQNIKWGLHDRSPSKGSLNLELSESEFSKSRRSSVESLGSLGSFTVEGVPFIDEPGGVTPDQETVREIQELSKQFSKLSNGPIGLEGAFPVKADWEINEKEKNSESLSDSSRNLTTRGCSTKNDEGSTADVEKQPTEMKNGSLLVDEKDVDDIKKGKLVRDFDLVSYNMNVLASRATCTLPALGKNCSDPNLNRSKVRSLSRGHSPPEKTEKCSQSDSDLRGGWGLKHPSSRGLVDGQEKMIQVPLVNGEIFDACDEVVAMDENGESSLENGGENEAQLSEKERATLLDSLFETDSDGDDGSCSQDASELASSDSHPDEKEFLRLMEDKGDAKRQVVRQITHNRVSLMHVDICSVYNRFGDKERQALSSFDFLEKALNQEMDGDNTYLEDEMNNGTKKMESHFTFTPPTFMQLHPDIHLSNFSRPYMEDTQGGDGQVSPFAVGHEMANTSMSSSLSTGSLSS